MKLVSAVFSNLLKTIQYDQLEKKIETKLLKKRFIYKTKSFVKYFLSYLFELQTVYRNSLRRLLDDSSIVLETPEENLLRFFSSVQNTVTENFR